MFLLLFSLSLSASPLTESAALCAAITTARATKSRYHTQPRPEHSYPVARLLCSHLPPAPLSPSAYSLDTRHSIFDFDPAYLDTAAHPDSPISPRLPLASTVSHQITALREKDNNCRRVIHNRLFSFPPAEPLLCGPLILQPDSNKNNTLLCCPRQVSDLYRYWL